MPEATEQDAADVAKGPRGPSPRPLCSVPAHRGCLCGREDVWGARVGVGQEGRMWEVVSGGVSGCVTGRQDVGVSGGVSVWRMGVACQGRSVWGGGIRRRNADPVPALVSATLSAGRLLSLLKWLLGGL